MPLIHIEKTYTWVCWWYNYSLQVIRKFVANIKVAMCQYKESLEAFPFHGHTNEVTLPTASLQEVSPPGCTHHAQK